MKKVRGIAGIGFLLAVFGSFALMAFLLLALAMFGKNNLDDTSTTPTGDATTPCGQGVETIHPQDFKMLPTDDSGKSVTKGKLGSEKHLDNVTPTHYCGKDSGDCGAIEHTGFASTHTTDQERWYFNAEWGGWLADGQILDTRKGASLARRLVRHAKVIVVNPKNNKALIASVEEYGPARWVSERDGIWYGAPPEVRNFLATGDAYTGNPDDGKGEVQVSFVPEEYQETAKLGPCTADQGIGGSMRSIEK